MKRMIALALVLLGLIGIPNVSLATNWVAVYKTIDLTAFIDLDSVKIIRYKPPFYILEVDTRSINYSGKSLDSKTKYFYDYNNKEIKAQVIALRHPGKKWTYGADIGKTMKPYIVPYGTEGEEEANLAFQKAYNMRFR